MSKALSKLGASPMDKFMSGLADMMSGQKPDEADVYDADVQQQQPETQDMDGFRSGLIRQTRYHILHTFSVGRK